MAKTRELEWSLPIIWNTAFINRPEEINKPRGHLHASELGGSMIEIFYKLQGEPYTNTFSDVNYRKMEAGRMFEAVVRFVLKRSGILKKSQQEANFQFPGLLATHGRLDFVAGGQIDQEQIENCAALIRIMFEELEFPTIYLRIAEAMLQYLQTLVGKNQLKVYVLEIKSVSDFVYRMLENAVRPLNSHHLQAFHYLLSKEMPVAKLDYVNRDDVRINEKLTFNDKANLKEYKDWIEQMSDYVYSNTVPPKEDVILFFEDSCTFTKNTTGVEWCKYLTKIYGYPTTQAFRDHIMPMVDTFNYVYKRCVNPNIKLTDDNHKRIREAKVLFPNWDYLVDLGKLRKVQKETRNATAGGQGL
jgi:hypothetical protein